jgi:hypothetical protein
MLFRHALAAAPLAALLLAQTAAADLRPKARPFAAEAAVTETAVRPRPNPAHAAPSGAALRVDVTPMSAEAITALVSQALVRSAPDIRALPVDPPLLAAVQRFNPAYTVVTSTANAPVPVAVTAPTLRPRARVQDQAAPAVLVRPRPRPPLPDRALPPGPDAALLYPALAMVAAPLPRPAARPRGLSARRAVALPEAEIVLAAITPPVNPGKPLVRSRKGSVCGDPSIRGETVPPIPARMKGCGLAEPVRVTEIDGIRLSTPATISCDTAKAMKTWINAGLRPAFGRRNPPAALTIAASYNCRPRNNIPGNPVSEHGRGKAMDISAVVLESGAVVDVRRDYRGSKALRAAHKAGCGPFGTTLGPGSDGYHEDHLHFDIANRGRPYCR